MLAQQLKTTKKTVIEAAILSYAKKIEAEKKFDVLQHTLGAWHRRERTEETVKYIRDEFRKSMERHQQ